MGLDGILADLFKILKDAAANVLHSIYKQIWKTQQWPWDWKRSGFITIPKKGNAKECSNYHTILFISHAGKVMLKILQTRLQQYMNQELPDVQVGFIKGRGTRYQTTNIHWIIEKARKFQKTNKQTNKQTSVSLTMLKPLTVWITTNCGTFLKRWEYQISLPVSWETYMQVLGRSRRVRTGHGTMDWFKIGKGRYQGYILSPWSLSYLQSTSCKMPGWMKHKLESRLPGEISIPQICRWYHHYGRKQKRTKIVSWWR